MTTCTKVQYEAIKNYTFVYCEHGECIRLL